MYGLTSSSLSSLRVTSFSLFFSHTFKYLQPPGLSLLFGIASPLSLSIILFSIAWLIPVYSLCMSLKCQRGYLGIVFWVLYSWLDIIVISSSQSALFSLQNT